MAEQNKHKETKTQLSNHKKSLRKRARRARSTLQATGDSVALLPLVLLQSTLKRLL